ncbi:MAG: universal stress protein [Flavobacteriales bacterium]|nr:universal stress protein [Flavobacteriales bacterium]
MMVPNRLQRIFHPTNLEAESESAFLHALRLAVAGPATLTVLHVGAKADLSMGALPHVRSTLRKWGIIERENGSDELSARGIGVRKVLATGDPLQACLEHLTEHQTDLVVLHTHQREGRMAWFHGRVAEPMAREARLPTLIVPGRAKGFVDATTGALKLHRVLVPIASMPSAADAIALAGWVADVLKADHGRFTLLHVGSGGHAPQVHPPKRPGWEWTMTLRDGDVVQEIVRAEKELRPDLVVMTTKGHDGFLDALRGSHTERVLRQIDCPMLTAVA